MSMSVEGGARGRLMPADPRAKPFPKNTPDQAHLNNAAMSISVEGGASGRFMRARTAIEASSSSSGRWPRATATAVPTICRI